MPSRSPASPMGFASPAGAAGPPGGATPSAGGSPAVGGGAAPTFGQAPAAVATPAPAAAPAPQPFFAFSTQEEAENAFMQLLRDKGVRADWTWEQTIRAIVTEPLYKVFKTLAERKAVWQTYVERLRTEAETHRRERLASLRPSVGRALEAGGGLKPYASLATFKKRLGSHSVWKKVGDDEELAQALYAAFVQEARERAEEADKAQQAHNRDALLALLKAFEIGPTTPWRDAHRTILESAEFRDDAELQQMGTAEMLEVFDAHMRAIEADARAQHDAEARRRRREQRRNREAFQALLQEAVESGKLSSRSTWASFLPQIREDARLLAIAGQPGSTPQQLFYDRLDELERHFSEHMKALQGVLRRRELTVHDAAQWEEVAAAARAPDAPALLSQLPERELHDLFEELLVQAERDAREERRRAERRVRHLADDLRYALKRVDPPLELDAPFEQVLPRIRELPEYAELERLGAADAAPGAWDKFVRRQAEKAAEQRDAPSRPRPDYRDLDETQEERKRKEPVPDSAPGGAPEDPRATRRRVRYNDDEEEEDARRLVARRERRRGAE